MPIELTAIGWQVIGHYQPPPDLVIDRNDGWSPTYTTIYRALEAIVQPLGLTYNMLDIRSPGYTIYQRLDIAANWHQDGDVRNGDISHIILWSNIQPTLFRLKDQPESVWSPPPGSLVLVHNPSVQHHIPLEPIESTRVFARFWDVKRSSL